MLLSMPLQCTLRGSSRGNAGSSTLLGALPLWRRSLSLDPHHPARDFHSGLSPYLQMGSGQEPLLFQPKSTLLRCPNHARAIVSPRPPIRSSRRVDREVNAQQRAKNPSHHPRDRWTRDTSNSRAAQLRDTLRVAALDVWTPPNPLCVVLKQRIRLHLGGIFR